MVNFCTVRWKNSSSCIFSVRSGIRQGGILSPISFQHLYQYHHFSTYRLSDFECHIGGCYVGCIAYADDPILLPGSLTQLQMMLQLCENEAQNMDLYIVLNCKKSC